MQAKQFPLALEVAKSFHGATAHGEALFFSVVTEYAKAGRIDDARAVLSLFGEKSDPKMRGFAVAALVRAQAKAGGTPSAVQMTAQIGEPVIRRATLLTLARELPQ